MKMQLSISLMNQFPPLEGVRGRIVLQNETRGMLNLNQLKA
jgi:hypothetical protein